MRDKTRFQLKRPTGWFAAGREVACALELLSDAAFKLFVWLCLNAERRRGMVSATPSELARALGKNETDLQVALAELQRQSVCTLDDEGVIQIDDRFWPYQRGCDSSPSEESRRYVEAVKSSFLGRRCVQSSFTAADERLALSLYRRNVPLIHVEHAILLGAARKYASWRQPQPVTSISSLHYFTDLFQEVQQELSAHYWSYIAHKVETFERKWAGLAARKPEANPS